MRKRWIVIQSDRNALPILEVKTFWFKRSGQRFINQQNVAWNIGKTNGQFYIPVVKYAKEPIKWKNYL